MRIFAKDEDGTMMLESVFCILATMIVIMMIMVMGFLVYQHAMMGIVANQVAEEIAVTYKFPEMKDASHVSKKDILGVGHFRNVFFREESFREGNEKTLKKIARTRLTKSSLAKDAGGYEVTLERINDDIGRYHYKITVKNKYTFFFGEILNLLGLEETERLKATTYVAGTDASAYIDSVDTTYLVVGKVTKCDFIDTILSTVQTFAKALLT